MGKYERDDIRRMQGYTWGEQPDASQVIKLNTNENPYPPTPAVDAALDALKGAQLRRYPPPTAASLRDAVAQHHTVHPDQVVITHGGDEALRLAMTTFVPAGGVFGMAEPSYSLYPVLADVQGAQVVRIPLTENWLPPTDLAARLNQAGARLTCLVNPHAPSGTLLDVDQLTTIAQELDGVLLVDEAYVDFIDPARHYASENLLAEDNVLILRTFSKGYSLAGMRLGYLLGDTGLIEPIVSKTRDSYNVDWISQQVGIAAIEDQTYAKETWRKVREQRRLVANNLGQLGMTCNASESNFLLASVPTGQQAEEIYLALKARNILVRYFDQPGLRDKLRISIGSEPENEALLAALTDVLT